MHQTKKGNQWHFGIKVHMGVDGVPGLIHMKADITLYCRRRFLESFIVRTPTPLSLSVHRSVGTLYRLMR